MIGGVYSTTPNQGEIISLTLEGFPNMEDHCQVPLYTDGRSWLHRDMQRQRTEQTTTNVSVRHGAKRAELVLGWAVIRRGPHLNDHASATQNS